MNSEDRKQRVLALIIEQYIQTGEPTGSKKLCEGLPQAVSPATIRNDMAWLTDMGYINQPHTSAGRVPTQKGYRYYIDRLMQRQELSRDEQNYIGGMLGHASQNPEHFLETACALLADMTGLAAISTTPSDKQAKILRIELMPTGIKTVLLLVMTSTGLFKSRLCRLEVEANYEVIAILRKLINDYFTGRILREITPAFIQTLAVSLGDMTLIVMPLLVAVHETIRGAADSQLLLEGQSNLLAIPELDPIEAKAVLEFLSHREKLLTLLSRDEKHSAAAYIGKENGRPELNASSMVISTYKLGENGIGKIAVLGSTRMDYAKIISHLDYFAKTIGEMLSQNFEEE
ncbi:MAG: heat-inducible transcriptional repressor HrcA [Oscillospiraceae bacterium]|nr:heat-inducible transcriptional repressor HrcA [Oscillospiraceae bacterium]